MGKRGASLSSRGKRPLFDDGRGGWVEEGMTGGGRFAPSRLHGNGEGG